MGWNRWIAKNRVWWMILSVAVIGGIFTAVGVYTKLSAGTIVASDIVIVLFCCLYINICRNKILKNGIKALEEFCDPGPLLEATEELLSYGVKGSIEQIVLIDYCDALRWLGKYDEAYEKLCQINIDKESSMIHVNKVIYYNNLADICTLMGKYDEANIWYDKMMQIYDDIKDGALKKMVAHVASVAKAYDFFRKGEYKQTIEAIETFKAEVVRHNIDSKQPMKARRNMQVDNTLLCARAYIALGDMQNAKEKLNFVIGNGYKLYAVTEAKEMLENIG